MFAQAMITRLEAMNADNRMVLSALEEGRISPGRVVLGDTTGETKAEYRRRIGELDALIFKARRVSTGSKAGDR